MPYKCNQCQKEFRLLSAMMNHTADKHGNQNSSHSPLSISSNIW
jgi:hypothetical protein